MKNEYFITSPIVGGESKTPPISNLDSDINLCIDYVSCSFDFFQMSYRYTLGDSWKQNEYMRGIEKMEKLYELLMFPNKDERQFLNKGNKAYRDGVMCLGEHIKIFFTGPVSKSNNLPTNFLEIKGQGCKDFIDRGGDFTRLFDFLINEGAVFTRTDPAIDVYTSKYFDMNKLKRYISNSWYVSPMGKGKYIMSWSEHGKTIDGETLYFGSESSRTFICIYDKKLERFAHGVEIFYPAWYRIEIRFKQERAQWFVAEFLKQSKGEKDYNFITEALYAVLDFKVPVVLDEDTGKRIKTNITDRKFYETAIWWLKLLGVSKKATFEARDKNPLSIHKNMDWIERSGSKIISRVFTYSPNNFLLWIYKMIIKKYEELDNIDFTAIDEAREKDKLPGLTAKEKDEIRDMLKHMKLTLDKEEEDES